MPCLSALLYSQRPWVRTTALILACLSLSCAPQARGEEVGTSKAAPAAAKKQEPKSPPDVLVFVNGDRLTGQFVRAVGKNITFHSDIVGEVIVPWDKVKDLKTSTAMAVLANSAAVLHHKLAREIPEGTIALAGGNLTVQPQSKPPLEIPIKQVQYVLDTKTLDREVRQNPGVFEAWHGTLTAGATVVQATQQEYTFTGGIALIRSVPTVSWLDSRNRTTIDFNGSYGKITQPAYTELSGTPPVVTYTPASVTKSSIYHADAERDGYFSPRFYVLAQTAFDHNFAQDLDLQQVYGAGIGWTAIKRPQQELDLKTTLQYEGQTFIEATAGENQDLIGSSLAVDYRLRLPHNLQFKQSVTYEPAYNNGHAYSGSETDTLIIPLFKRFSFSLGSIDSYLNDPPPAVPPTKQNSLQVTTGLSYTLKSKY